MAVARVHSQNHFTPQDFITNMNIACSPVKEAKIWAVQENLFTILCFA